jgi:TolA-binding protein
VSSSLQFGGVGDIFRDTLLSQVPEVSDARGSLAVMPLLPRRSDQVQDKLHRLEEQMRTMNSKVDEMAETFESRRADDEAAAIAVERIRSGAAEHKEDGAEALAKLGIKIAVAKD